jgi:hypothetical protein
VSSFAGFKLRYYLPEMDQMTKVLCYQGKRFWDFYMGYSRPSVCPSSAWMINAWRDLNTSSRLSLTLLNNKNEIGFQNFFHRNFGGSVRLADVLQRKK